MKYTVTIKEKSFLCDQNHMLLIYNNIDDIDEWKTVEDCYIQCLSTGHIFQTINEKDLEEIIVMKNYD